MNNKYYHHYNFYDIEKEENFDASTLTILKNFKAFQQTTEETCGPVCALMVLTYLKDKDVDGFTEISLAKSIGTKKYPIGTKLKNLVDFFKSLGRYEVVSSIDYRRKNGLCFPEFEDFKSFILENLKQGNPIIVENIDYGGHYRVIIGYDNLSSNGDEDILIFADPYDDTDGLRDGYNYFPASRFYYMWFDDHCLEDEYKKQAFIVIKNKA